MGVIAVLILLAATGLGYLKLMLEASRREDQRLFIDQYLSKFQKLADSYRDDGIDEELYYWLTHRVLRMCRLATDSRVWRPHGEQLAQESHRQAQLLRELLEDLDQRHVPIERVKSSRAFLVRFLGAFDDAVENLGKRRFNPFILFREGIQLVLLAPVLAYLWATRAEDDTVVDRVTENEVFARWSGGLATFILLASVLILIFGWQTLESTARAVVIGCYDLFFLVVDSLQELIDGALGRVPPPPPAEPAAASGANAVPIG